MKGMRRYYFFIVIFTFSSLFACAQKAKYQSDIIYHLSQQVTWPQNDESYKFIIGVVGSQTDYQSFQKLALKKSLFQDNPIEVRYFKCADVIADCQILYISDECKDQMAQIVKKTKNEPILIVAGKEGYGEQGAVINFVETDGKLKFELNQQQAENRKLRVSEKLKDLAIVI